jgi:tetratricopeptide (TPR) repeat protein
VFFGVTAVVPVYRSEALRYGMRRLIDENAREGKGDLRQLVARAEENIGRATVIDPANAQAWADLAYAKSLEANLHPNLTPGELVRLGAEAEKAARRATGLSAAVPESWVRLGIALDMQGRHDESDPFFRRCLQLAPRIGNFWFYYAFHLSGIPGSEAPARAALATCLELDGGNSAALALREQLSGRE